MSRTFSMNSGSLDSLNVLTRCGRRLNARQIRLTAVWLSPHRRASVRVLQCVASRGVVSSVTRITRSTSASVIRRGAPGRGSSSNPSRRWPRKRVRHLPMVCLVRRNSRATTVFVLPAAHSSTKRARSARARAVVGRRAQRSSVSRSSPVRDSGGIGRPVRMGVPPSIGGTLGVRNLFHLFTTQDTSGWRHNLSTRVLLIVPAMRMLYGTIDETIGHFRRYERDKLSAKLRRAGFWWRRPDTSTFSECPGGFLAAAVVSGNDGSSQKTTRALLEGRCIWPPPPEPGSAQLRAQLITLISPEVADRLVDRPVEHSHRRNNEQYSCREVMSPPTSVLSRK